MCCLVLQTLFDILDSYWEVHFVECTLTELRAGPAGKERSLCEVDTSFARLLKQLKWLPTLEVCPASELRPKGKVAFQVTC